MAHAEWCGKPCCECINPCWIDQMLPCSPDCENLQPDGTADQEKCRGCEVYEEIIIMGYEEE